MKLIMFLLFSISANATTYYVSSSDGNDSDNGITEATAWLTIAKVNASVTTGDFVKFKAGDTWREKLTVPASTIAFGSYGSGVKPLITALQTVSGLTNVGNIWSATKPLGATSLNTVLVNGIIRAKGRYPNTGYLSMILPNTATFTQIHTDLSGTPNYTGAEIVIRTNNFVTDVSTVTSQSAGTINFSPATTYDQPGWLYFFQNRPSLLDTEGEWADSAGKIYVYAPLEPVVQVSTIDTLVNLAGNDYITFDGIDFRGANMIGISFDNSDYFSIINSSFNYSGKNAVQGYPANRALIQNDSFQNSLNDAVRVFGNHATVTGNYINYTGYYSGMGANGNGAYMAVYGGLDTFTVTNNTILNTGFNAIYWEGRYSLIKNNFIDTFCFNKDDGAGIYTFVGSPASHFDSGSFITSNIIRNGIGAGYGNFPSSAAAGVYFDLGVHGVTADSNTIFNTTHSGINFFEANHINIYNNTVVDSAGIPFRLWTETYLNVKRNIFYSTSGSVNTPCFFTPAATNANSNIDSNYYLIKNTNTTRFKRANSYYNLADWIVATGWDINSSEDQSLQTSRIGTLYINPTLSDSTVTFSGWKVNARGTLFNSEATIQPFQSALLFPANAPVTIRGTVIGNLKFSN